MNEGDIIQCSNCGEKICRLTKDVRQYDPIQADAFEFLGELKDYVPIQGRVIPHCPNCGFAWFRTLFRRG